jgi:hypothetical protein
VSERRVLSRRARTVLAVGVVVAIGLVAVVVVVVARRERVERTRRLLESLRENGPKRANERHRLWGEIRRRTRRPVGILVGPRTGRQSGDGFDAASARDAWGTPIRLQAPGPVHGGGWDIWSCGPNGVDEKGGGDDILIGEDLWPPPTPLEMTRDTLDVLAARIRASREPILADGSQGDETGLWAVARGLEGRAATVSGSQSGQPGWCPDLRWVGSVEWIEADDGWNRPVRYRCPGPVHAHGWDLYSFGPDGIDDHGGGDDVLVGEDVALETSR